MPKYANRARTKFDPTLFGRAIYQKVIDSRGMITLSVDVYDWAELTGPYSQDVE